MKSRPILVVDDDPTNLALMRQTLCEHYSMVFASNGTQAMRAAERHDPALVLLDIQLPDFDGYEVCRRLKADPRFAHTPVIFVTTLSEVGDEEAGFAVGGVDYIVKPASPPIVRARVRTHLSLVKVEQLERSHRDSIYMLGAAGHYNDNDTGVHIWRMAAYARALAEAAGWSQERCSMLELAAPMHDTGKIGIPDAILRKPGPLDEEEWRVMRTHSRIGHEILCTSSSPVFQLAAEIAHYHHERWDGTGYPDGLAGQDIPHSARIVAIADVFDALSMQRAYKQPWPMDRILDYMLSNSGQHFQPELIDLFQSILPRIMELQEHWNAQEAA